jgi:hypothetical protein
MSEAETPGLQHRATGGAEIATFRPPQRIEPAQVSFDRHELTAILNLYGRMVSHGDWRDYAIDFLRDRAVFSVFRRSSELPLYRVVKTPALARRQGQYAVVEASGRILKRGHELVRVLQFIEPMRLVAQ